MFQWQRRDLAIALIDSDIWIAEDGGIIGYILTESKAVTFHIISLAVDPEHQRKGVATQLIHEVESYYKESKCKKVKLEVHTDNPAQVLYFKLGYRVTGFKKKYYSDGSSAIAMCKELQ